MILISPFRLMYLLGFVGSMIVLWQFILTGNMMYPNYNGQMASIGSSICSIGWFVIR